jgi:hypothetical protein
MQRAVFANEGSKRGLVKNLLTRRVSEDATVAVSLSKTQEGRYPCCRHHLREKDDLSKSNRVITYM